ncbi:MAG: hypothetical protein LCI02_28110 [Proteobacteria bacterium]|nr:hypothetical protein [Pseudomonadota bacterium]
MNAIRNAAIVRLTAAVASLLVSTTLIGSVVIGFTSQAPQADAAMVAAPAASHRA